MKPVFSIITALRPDWESLSAGGWYFLGMIFTQLCQTLQRPMFPNKSNSNMHYSNYHYLKLLTFEAAKDDTTSNDSWFFFSKIRLFLMVLVSFLLLHFPLNHLSWEYCSSDFRRQAFCPRHIQMSGLFFFFSSLKPCETVIRCPLWGFRHYGRCHFMSLGCNESLRFILGFLFKLTQILPPLDGSARLKNKRLDDGLAYTAVYACVYVYSTCVLCSVYLSVWGRSGLSATSPPINIRLSLFFSSSHIPVCPSGLREVQFWM